MRGRLSGCTKCFLLNNHPESNDKVVNRFEFQITNTAIETNAKVVQKFAA